MGTVNMDKILPGPQRSPAKTWRTGSGYVVNFINYEREILLTRAWWAIYTVNKEASFIDITRKSYTGLNAYLS